MFAPVILFEGVDGSGKSTALTRLKSFLERLKLPVHVVESISYEDFLKAHDPVWYDITNDNVKYLQYLSYEVNSYYKNIEPYLGKAIILIDRYIPSCYAYNPTTPCEFTGSIVSCMDQLCQTFYRPDIVFVYDVEDAVLWERLKRTEQPDWVLQQWKINQIRDKYREFYKKYNWNMFFLDGNTSLDDTLRDQLTLLQPIITFSPAAFTGALGKKDKK